jgi:predicted NBD/HSP70 family sugar kinase
VSNEAPGRLDDVRTVRGTVLSLLRDEGPLPRIEIARRAGVSATTITRAVNQLVDDEIVLEGGSISPSRLGRPATELTIRPESYFVVGVQIGVGFVQLGVLDVLGEQRATRSFSYDVALPATEVVERTAIEIGALIAASGIDRRLVLGVGVAVPGPVDPSGRRMLLPINLSWRDVAVADILESLLDLQVRVEHNVRSMALAEVRFGVGRGLGSVAFVYLRTGLGAGLVVEGQPFSGGVHGAIELGHLQVLDPGEECICGNHGCLETVVSDRALARRVAELGLPATDNPLTAIWNASTPEAEAVAEQIVTSIAKGLASLVNLLNPELILLGGALAAIPAEMAARIDAATRVGVFPTVRDSIRIQPSTLGMDAGVLGGGTAALDSYFYA